MEIFKPKADYQAQKKTRGRKPRARGAVLKAPATNRQERPVSFKQQSTEFLEHFTKLRGLKNSWWVMGMVIVTVVSVANFGLRTVKAEMPIERVSVQGDFYQLDKAELEQTLAPLVGSNYLDVNIKNIKSSLINFAWVQSVEVRKVWPDSLEVSVIENQAIATWGEDGFVNEFGRVFKPTSVNEEFLKGIPDLNGLDQQSDLVLSTYAKLAELTRNSELKITHCSLVANNYWRIKFDQGSEILLSRGREWQSLDTFLRVYQQELKHADRQLEIVDMRYNNGFSVEFGDQYDMKIGLEQRQQETDLNKDNSLQIKSSMNVGKHHG